MSKIIEKYRKYYLDGAWSKERVDNLLAKGKITQDEYDYILGETER